MRLVNLRDLKKGQIVVEGELGVGKFKIVEVESNEITFINRETIDMKNGSMVKEEDGYISHEESRGSIMVLNSSDLKKVDKIRAKMKMLEELSS